jgi:hypothetical protein
MHAKSAKKLQTASQASLQAFPVFKFQKLLKTDLLRFFGTTRDVFNYTRAKS